MLVANLLALIPLAIAIIVLWLPYQFYAALGAPLALFDDPVWPQWGFWLLGLILAGLSLVLHEGIHAVVLLWQGHHPTFGYQSGYPYVAIQPGQFLTRRQYLAMALTPLISLTLAGGLLLLMVPPGIGQMLALTLLLNAAASIGDLAVADRARRLPPNTLFAADDSGIKVFVQVIENRG